MMTETDVARTPLIGAPIRRAEDLRFVRGLGTYLDDIAFTDTTHIAFVRSPHAHARIEAIDVARTAAMPGVLVVLTGSDFIGRTLPLPRKEAEFFVADVAHPVLPHDTVAYAGQVVAAVSDPVTMRHAAPVGGPTKHSISGLPGNGDPLRYFPNRRRAPAA